MAKISDTTRRRIRGIAIIIIFLSLGWAIFSAMNQKDNGPNPDQIFKKSNKTFEEKNSFRKKKLRLSNQQSQYLQCSSEYGFHCLFSCPG